MSDNDQYDPEAIRARTALAPLHRPVMDGIERGVDRANEYFEGRSLDPHLYAHIVRDHAAEELARSREAIGFRMKRLPLAGVDVIYSGYELKLWKKYSGGYLPPPGESEPRQAFLRQPVQPFIAYAQIERWVRPATKLVYVWDLEDSLVRLWLVCPKSFDVDNLWQPGEAHWEIPVDHPAEDLMPDINFAGDDEDLPINLDEAAGESEDDDEEP